MAAVASGWVPLEPKLRPNSRGMQLFLSFAAKLRGTECDRDALERLRTDSLLQADECAGSQQVVRVLISVLCDLRGKGWTFRIRDGVAAVAPPEAGEGSVLERKQRVR